MAGRSSKLSDKRALPGAGPVMLIGGAEVERMTADAPSGELGRVAARYFDDLIICEDRNSRGHKKGETAALILEGSTKA